MKSEYVVLALVATIVSCDSVSFSPEPSRTTFPRACDAKSVLDRLGHSIVTRDLRPVKEDLLRVGDMVALSSKTKAEGEEESSDMKQPFSDVESMVFEWNRALGPARYSRAVEGVLQTSVRLEGIGATLDVLEQSNLRFHVADREVTVPVDRLIRVGECWKIEDLSYPPR